MRKFYLYIVAVTVFLSMGCSSDHFVGAETPEEPNPVQGETQKALAFGSSSKSVTRASHYGADAAQLLNRKFIVGGFKGTGSTTSAATGVVFDNFVVNWAEHTAGTTESNTSDWEYAGITAQAPSGIAGNRQAVKYWDYTDSQYDFFAYSTSTVTPVTSGVATAGHVLVSAIDPANATTSAYTLGGHIDDLQKCYIADLVTAYRDETIDPAHQYQQEVQIVFRNLASRVRIGIYENIPGYSVKNVRFYTDASSWLGTAASTDVTLFTTGALDKDHFYTSGTYSVKFPTISSANKGKTDYNKAHVSFAYNTGTTSKSFGALNYTGKEQDEKTGTSFLGRSASTASYAGSGYTVVLPNEEGMVLQLRIDYTLEAIDGTGEEINVYGATAYVPAIYAAWKPNYAYTYLFKITDNTSGWTRLVNNAIGEDPEGLYPITFSAVVIDPLDNTQSTITTVAKPTPSITTYQKGHDASSSDYIAGDIYVQLMTDGALVTDLNATSPKRAQLYTLSRLAGEAEVMDALNIRANTTATTIIGCNNLTLTQAASNPNITTIPGVDGNDITVNAGEAAKFTATASTVYAYVYEVSDESDESIRTFVDLSATLTAPSDWPYGYYYDEACTSPVPTAYTPGYYYKTYTNRNTIYAVKVINVQ